MIPLSQSSLEGSLLTVALSVATLALYRILIKPKQVRWTEIPQGKMMRRVWETPRTGRISRLQPQDQEIPSLASLPEQHLVQVKVMAVGLNFADIFALLGLYSATPKGALVPGLEFSGVVEEVSRDVTSVKVGDKVFGFTRFGAYATRLQVPAAFVRKLPEGWNFLQGASFVVQALTAWHGLVTLGNIQRGDAVLVHSAAGGVGLNAMHILQAKEGIAVATIGSPKKAAFLKERCSLTSEQIIVRDGSRQGLRRQLLQALQRTGCEGYDIIMDALGGTPFIEGMRVLARNGRMITYGASTFMSAASDAPNWPLLVLQWLARPRVDPGELVQDNRSVMGFNLIWLTDKVEQLTTEMDAMMELAWDPPYVGRVFGFDQAHQAVRFLQSGQSVGKVVLQVHH